MSGNPPIHTARFKSCPREGASAGSFLNYSNTTVSSHAPVRGHHAWMRDALAIRKFQVMPP